VGPSGTAQAISCTQDRISNMSKASVSRSGSPWRAWLLWGTFVFLIAATGKLTYLQERMALPDVDHPSMDSLFHDEWARGLAFGAWTRDQESLRHEPYFRARCGWFEQ
jgi:hypothetical protein